MLARPKARVSHLIPSEGVALVDYGDVLTGTVGVPPLPKIWSSKSAAAGAETAGTDVSVALPAARAREGSR